MLGPARSLEVTRAHDTDLTADCRARARLRYRGGPASGYWRPFESPASVVSEHSATRMHTIKALVVATLATQPTTWQIHDHQESTRLRCGWRNPAAGLGWGAFAVLVIKTPSRTGGALR